MTRPVSHPARGLIRHAEAGATPLKGKSRFPQAEAFGFSPCPSQPHWPPPL